MRCVIVSINHYLSIYLSIYLGVITQSIPLQSHLVNDPCTYISYIRHQFNYIRVFSHRTEVHFPHRSVNITCFQQRFTCSPSKSPLVLPRRLVSVVERRVSVKHWAMMSALSIIHYLSLSIFAQTYPFFKVYLIRSKYSWISKYVKEGHAAQITPPWDVYRASACEAVLSALLPLNFWQDHFQWAWKIQVRYNKFTIFEYSVVAVCQERCKMWPQLLRNANRNSHVLYRITWPRMTLDAGEDYFKMSHPFWLQYRGSGRRSNYSWQDVIISEYRILISFIATTTKQRNIKYYATAVMCAKEVLISGKWYKITT